MRVPRRGPWEDLTAQGQKDQQVILKDPACLSEQCQDLRCGNDCWKEVVSSQNLEIGGHTEKHQGGHGKEKGGGSGGQLFFGDSVAGRMETG